MSANIPDTKLVSELLKPTGFNCPENLEGKTFEEATEGGGGDVELEDNKSAAINVTAYTSPVVVNPTEGKDAMKKVTVTLTNIPSPGATLRAWYDDNGGEIIYTKVKTPTTSDKAYVGTSTGLAEVAITAVTENSITVNGTEWVRDADSDFTF